MVVGNSEQIICDEELKRIAIEGMCTLRWCATNRTEQAGSMLEYVKNIPEVT